MMSLMFNLIKSSFYSLLSILLFINLSFAESSDELCVIADSAIVAASKIRGLKQKRDVPCYVRDKDKVKQYLLDTIEEKMPEEKLKNEGTLYKSLGFLPSDFDYKNGIVELYISQLGGYYDPEDDYFVMAAWMPAVLQTTIAVHELTHALQDQEFDLAGLIDPLKGTSDQLMARSALVEGDATAVMFDYSRKVMGQPGLATQDNVDSIIMQNVAGAAFMTGMNSAPSSLQYMLLFPYTSGLRFAHQLLKKGGYKEIDRAFKNLPSSTEEVLHPEKYFAGKKDYELISEEEILKIYPNTKVIYKDTFGEFSVSALLSTYTKDHLKAAKAAEGWGGDTAAILSDASAKQLVIWNTRWDSNKDAEEFFNAYADALSVHLDKWDHKKLAKSQTFAKDNNLTTLSLEANKVFLMVK